MTAHNDLTLAWEAWRTATLFKTWAKQNPGELKRLLDYRNGLIARPPMLTATGLALVDETSAWLATKPVADVGWEAWTVTELPKQRDPDSDDPNNKYTFGWAKSQRAAPGHDPDWQTNGYMKLADYPDEAVVVFRKQYVQGYPGAITNFHLVGGDNAHNGVSPIRSDWHSYRGVYEVVCQAEGDGTSNPYHWTIAQSAEIDRSAVYEERWHIRWRTDFTGYIHLDVYENDELWRTVTANNIRTQYPDQKPELFVWAGGYEEQGLTTTAVVRTTLDRRGKTLTEALADTPRYGSQAHSVSTDGGADSSVVQNGTL